MILAWKQRRLNKRSSSSSSFGIFGNDRRNNLPPPPPPHHHHTSTTCTTTTTTTTLSIPCHFRCPISLDLMKDPVTLSTGITYDRHNIDKWILAGNHTCPVTNQTLRHFDDHIPNHSIRRMIQEWCLDNKSFGIQTIPTPIIPVSSYEVTAIFSRIREACMRKDKNECRQLVDRIKNLAGDSEGNKNRIIDNGVGYVFAACFDSFAAAASAGDAANEESGSSWDDDYEELLKSILCELRWMFPLGSEGQSKIGSQKSMGCIARFINGKDLTAKQDAVIVWKRLLVCNSSGTNYAKELLKMEGVPEALFQIIKLVPAICPVATSSALTLIHHYILNDDGDDKVIKKFMKMGIVQMILEMLVDGENNSRMKKSITEKGLGVLDCLCNYEQGREGVSKNALTMPVLVKKILRVSDTGTELTVSIMWKLVVVSNKDEKRGPLEVAMEEVGVFEKMLVVLQMGCGGETKDRATELLKKMNVRMRMQQQGRHCLDGNGTSFIYVKMSC